MIKNIMETIISNKLDELTSKVTMCNCSKCRDDIMAFTLNHVPPRYVSTSSGELYIKVASLSNEEVHEVTITLLKAIQIVSENPKH